MRNETRSVIRRGLRLHKHVFAFFATSVGCGATDSYRVEGENGVWGGNGNAEQCIGLHQLEIKNKSTQVVVRK